MHNSRRLFLKVAVSMAATGAAAGTAAGIAAQTAAAQSQIPNPAIPGRFPPSASEPVGRRPFGTEPGPGPSPREILKSNQEDIKKHVARLSELVSELQKGLDDNDTKDILSLDVIHKTEEIEKLAKQIRGLIHG